jgi:Na+(H+)/acetate symporter ActP
MKSILTTLRFLALLGFASPSVAFAAAITGEVQKQPLNIIAIAMFIGSVFVTLGITYWAAGRTRSIKDFYTAGGEITGFQNGLAIAGGYMSAATLVVLSPAVWKSVLGNPQAVFPYDHPALFSMPLAFIMCLCWLVSKADSSQRAAREREAFDDQFIRAETGIGAAGAASH